MPVITLVVPHPAQWCEYIHQSVNEVTTEPESLNAYLDGQ